MQASGCERDLPAWVLCRVRSHTTRLDQWSSITRFEVEAVSPMPGLACPEANLDRGHCFSDFGTADLSFLR